MVTGLRVKDEAEEAKLLTTEQESQGGMVYKGAFSLPWARGRGPIGTKDHVSLRNSLDLTFTLKC